MTDYLKHEFDVDDFDLVSAIDELPLWSAPFGLSLLETIRLSPGMRVLDIGSGMGFPLIEIAQRLGPTGRAYGIDPWARAVERAQLKLHVYSIENAEISMGMAEDLPFDDGFFDLLTSNNGITNVQDVGRSLAECRRVARPGAQFVLTFNLPETMIEFYAALRSELLERGLEGPLAGVEEHIRGKRPSVAVMTERLAGAGFSVRESRESRFELRFVDAATMLNHHLIKYWFLPSWRELMDPEQWEPVFAAVQSRMDREARKNGAVVLSVPFVTLDCRSD